MQRVPLWRNQISKNNQFFRIILKICCKKKNKTLTNNILSPKFIIQFVYFFQTKKNLRIFLDIKVRILLNPFQI